MLKDVLKIKKSKDEVKTKKSRDEVTKKSMQDEVTRMFRVGRSGNPTLQGFCWGILDGGGMLPP